MIVKNIEERQEIKKTSRKYRIQTEIKKTSRNKDVMKYRHICNTDMYDIFLQFHLLVLNMFHPTLYLRNNDFRNSCLFILII